MLTHTHNLESHFLKIVYTKQIIDGKLQLIPFQLYTDGTIKRNQ